MMSIPRYTLVSYYLFYLLALVLTMRVNSNIHQIHVQSLNSRYIRMQLNVTDICICDIKEARGACFNSKHQTSYLRK